MLLLRTFVGAFAIAVSLLIAPQASAVEVETCISYEDAETDCWERPRWRYEFCYDRPAKRAFLQRYVNGNWRLVKEKDFTITDSCPQDYPYELKVSRKMKKDGVKRFRWVLQYGSIYAPIYEYFTVSRTSS